VWYGNYIHLPYQEMSTDERYRVMLSLCMFNGPDISVKHVTRHFSR